MSDNTAIQWTDSSWNPIRAVHRETGKAGWACTKISPGCAQCYAEAINKRLGTGEPYTVGAMERVEIVLDQHALMAPLHWRKPRRVFLSSMTDVFGEFVSDEQLDRIFAVMALTPQHTYQVLTKRPERMRAYVSDINGAQLLALAVGVGRLPNRIYGGIHERCANPPLPNVWLGVSVEDQAAADLRIPELLATPAAVRFLSCEPLLGPLNLTAPIDAMVAVVNGLRKRTRERIIRDLGASGIDWAIVGGESGPHARPCDLAWIRSVVAQCRAANVPVFCKQLGNVWARAENRKWGRVADSKGGNPETWPEDLRVREFPR